jgi:hypothetical protein
MIPYADIAEPGDRRWTAPLLARLDAADLPEGELDDLVWALQAISDARSFATLEAILVDLARPPKVRETAGSVLGCMQYLVVEEPEEKLRRWWQEGDAVLRRYALSCMDAVACPDIVLEAATDRSHELHAQAIGCMAFNFDLPEHTRIKIAGLTHPDPKVRAAAACVQRLAGLRRGGTPSAAAGAAEPPRPARSGAGRLQLRSSFQRSTHLHRLKDDPHAQREKEHD